MEQYGYIDLLDIVNKPSLLKRSLLMFDSIIVLPICSIGDQLHDTFEEINIQPSLAPSKFVADYNTLAKNSFNLLKDLSWLRNNGMLGEMIITDRSQFESKRTEQNEKVLLNNFQEIF